LKTSGTNIFYNLKNLDSLLSDILKKFNEDNQQTTLEATTGNINYKML
jgi:hypothetical protein